MMNSSRRWLLIFGLAIGLLAVIAIVLVMTTTSRSAKPLLPADTPEGTVQRFILALTEKDYLTAQSYMAPPPADNKTAPYPPYDLQSQVPTSIDSPGWQATLGKTSVKDNDATVGVTVSVFRPSGPFGNSVNTFQVTFFLKKSDTSWKITSPVNLWWLY